MVYGGVTPEQCIEAGALAFKKEDEDAIDLAVIGGLRDPSSLDGYAQTSFMPFDPVGKRTEATVTDPQGGTLRFTKGAPQVILDMSDIDSAQATKAVQDVTDMAAKGYRALGVARSDEDGKTWSFLGILPLFDPPRDDSKETIRKAQEHGVSVKMVTGDDVAIASNISGQLGRSHSHRS